MSYSGQFSELIGSWARDKANDLVESTPSGGTPVQGIDLASFNRLVETIATAEQQLNRAVNAETSHNDALVINACKMTMVSLVEYAYATERKLAELEWQLGRGRSDDRR